MTLTYTLTEEDYLQSQLFVSSKSERVNKQRKKSWLILTSCFFVVSVLMYNRTDNILTIYFVIVGILTLIFYPKYQSSHYKKHYQRYIKDVRKDYFNEKVRVTFSDDVIETQDRTGSSTINLTELESTSETTSYFFVKLKSGPHLIIPKAQLDNKDEVRNKLISISKKFKSTFISELNWKWK